MKPSTTHITSSVNSSLLEVQGLNAWYGAAQVLFNAQLHVQRGEVVALTSLKGQWLLVAVGGGACDAACQENLYFQRQLRESLGKDKDRLDRVWFITDDAPVNKSLLPALSQSQVLRLKAEALQGWLKPAADHALADHLYVVDPMGNWMMRFPAPMNVSSAAKAKRDLERLMRASSSWDQAGR